MLSLGILLATAWAVDVELVSTGRSARDSGYGGVESLGTSVRLTGPERRVAVEPMFYASPWSRELSSLDQTLVEIAWNNGEPTDLQAARFNDLAGLSLWLDLAPLPPMEGERLAGGPHVVLGVDTTLQRYLEAAPLASGRVEVHTDELLLVGGPLLGLGGDLWFYERLGLRLLGFQRLLYQPAPRYSSRSPVQERELRLEHVFVVSTMWHL